MNKDINQKNNEYLREWRKEKLKQGWKSFGLFVPPELHELLHKLSREWRYKNKHLYNKEEK